jgi:translation initiation factor IF-1
MPKNSNDTIELEGVVTKLHPNTMFNVQLDEGGEILAHLSGKLRKRYIKITAGDRVRVEISKYDFSKGRIVYRLSERTVFNVSRKNTNIRKKKFRR